jgi:hypothetical protein
MQDYYLSDGDLTKHLLENTFNMWAEHYV